MALDGGVEGADLQRRDAGEPVFPARGVSLPAPDAVSTPHPDSVGKYSIFIGLRDLRCCKILSGKDLAAESSQERAYGRGIGCFSANRPSRGLLFPLWRNSRINLQNRAEKNRLFLVRISHRADEYLRTRIIRSYHGFSQALRRQPGIFRPAPVRESAAFGTPVLRSRRAEHGPTGQLE